MENLNGYQMQADSYKAFLEKNPDTPQATRQEMESKIKIFSFLATLDKQERLYLFDSGIYNDVCRGFLQMAIDQTETDAEAGERITNALHFLFDTTSAAKALQYIGIE